MAKKQETKKIRIYFKNYLCCDFVAFILYCCEQVKSLNLVDEPWWLSGLEYHTISGIFLVRLEVEGLNLGVSVLQKINYFFLFTCVWTQMLLSGKIIRPRRIKKS